VARVDTDNKTEPVKFKTLTTRAWFNDFVKDNKPIIAAVAAGTLSVASTVGTAADVWVDLSTKQQGWAVVGVAVAIVSLVTFSLLVRRWRRTIRANAFREEREREKGRIARIQSNANERIATAEAALNKIKSLPLASRMSVEPYVDTNQRKITYTRDAEQGKCSVSAVIGLRLRNYAGYEVRPLSDPLVCFLHREFSGSSPVCRA
jgi:hypothetical protein